MPFADLTDVRCRYEIMGNGDPLLMIAGLGSSYGKWGTITDELARSFTLILFDNRGIGQSAAKRTPQTLGDFACDCVELLDHLQLDRAHVLGLSLGGMIAQQLANDHPSRVDRLVLISCTNRFGPYLRQMAWLLEQAVRRFPSGMFQRTIEVLGTSPGYFDAHTDEIELMLAAVGEAGEQRSAIARQLWCLGCEDMAPPDRYRIAAPTLVIAGESDVLIPSIYARRMAGEIPGSEFLAIPACGHNPLQEKPAIAIRRIVDFLSRPTGRNHRENRVKHWIHHAMMAMEEGI